MAKEQVKEQPSPSDELIKKLSEVEKMTPEEKEKFRRAGGTAVEG